MTTNTTTTRRPSKVKILLCKIGLFATFLTSGIKYNTSYLKLTTPLKYDNDNNNISNITNNDLPKDVIRKQQQQQQQQRNETKQQNNNSSLFLKEEMNNNTNNTAPLSSMNNSISTTATIMVNDDKNSHSTTQNTRNATTNNNNTNNTVISWPRSSLLEDMNNTNNTIPYLNELQKYNLTLSIRQQIKFYKNKERIIETFPKQMLYRTTTDTFHAYILNENFGFRHIFKNGGTTIEYQIGNKKQVPKHIIDNNKIKLIATVRDPIDHFLSGWQECGKRFQNFMEYNKTSDNYYNIRISKWLTMTKQLAYNHTNCRKAYPQVCICALHSLPQANFLIDNINNNSNKKTTKKKKNSNSNDDNNNNSNNSSNNNNSNSTSRVVVDNSIVLVGHLYELSNLLTYITKFQYNNSIELIGRNSSSDEIKNNFFPIKKHLLSNETMINLCEFLQLDYFLFDFPLPTICQK